MRILYVATDAEIGGAEVLLETLGTRRHTGDEADLVVLMGPGALSDRLERAMDTVTYLGFGEQSRNPFAMAAALDRVVAERQPDVISSHMFHADLVVALLPASTAARVTTIHTQRFGRGVHPLTRIVARGVALLSRRFDAVIATSEGAADFARRYRYAHEPHRVPNAVGLAETPAFSPRSRAFLSLARFHPVKGHAELFAAFAACATDYPDWRLICAGPGVEVGNVDVMALIDRAQARHLVDDGRIELLGAVQDVGALMGRSAALVISSTYGESAPIVGVEALAHSIPVITTDVGVSKHYSEPELVAAPGSADDLARVLGHYASLSDDERVALSVAARERCIADFGIETVISELDGVYRAAIARHDARGQRRSRAARR